MGYRKDQSIGASEIASLPGGMWVFQTREVFANGRTSLRLKKALADQVDLLRFEIAESLVNGALQAGKVTDCDPSTIHICFGSSGPGASLIIHIEPSHPLPTDTVLREGATGRVWKVAVAGPTQKGATVVMDGVDFHPKWIYRISRPGEQSRDVADFLIGSGRPYEVV